MWQIQLQFEYEWVWAENQNNCQQRQRKGYNFLEIRRCVYIIDYTLSHWIVFRFVSSCVVYSLTHSLSREFVNRMCCCFVFLFAHTCGTHSFSVCKRKSFCTTGGQKNNLTVRHILWTSQMILTSFITISWNTSNDKCNWLLCTAVFYIFFFSSSDQKLGCHFFFFR